MKKVLSYIASLALVLSLLMYPSYEAQAANVSIGVSSSKVNIGENVTVSVTVPDGITATVDLSFSTGVLSFVSASTDVGTNGGIVTMNIGKYSVAGTNTVSVTFKANTSGTASLSASVVSAVDNNTAEETTLGGASASITVANQTTSNTPSQSGNDSSAQQSGDNSLASLKLSSGTLSPEFKYNVTKYTATVGYDVSSVVVSATPSHAKATIESVTGNGSVNLNVGQNTIQVVVKAENGVKATYTIVVTREAEGGTTTTTEDETPVVSDSILQWKGQALQPTEIIPKDSIPADFEQDEISINGVEMPCLTFANGNLKVLHLASEDDTTGLYVYDEAQQVIYPFVKMESENGYIMVLLPDEANAPAPEGYQSCSISIEGKGVVTAYQFVALTTDDDTTSWFGPETYYAAEPVLTDFYLIYCMNNAGETSWYVYDSVEQTYQRYLGSIHTPVVESTDVETSADSEAVDKLEAELEAAKTTQMIIIGVAIVVIVILIVIIVVMIMKKRAQEDEEFDGDDYEDDEEYDSQEDEDTTVEENDEIEIEFYEMSSVTEMVAEEEDDEVEIEFYEMPSATKEVVVEKRSDFVDMEALLLKETESSEKVIAPEKEKKVVSASQKKQAVVVEEDDDDDLEFIDLD